MCYRTDRCLASAPVHWRARGLDRTDTPDRPKVIQSADVFVDAAGLIYATDYNAGLSIIEFAG